MYWITSKIASVFTWPVYRNLQNNSLLRKNVTLLLYKDGVEFKWLKMQKIDVYFVSTKRRIKKAIEFNQEENKFVLPAFSLRCESKPIELKEIRKLYSSGKLPKYCNRILNGLKKGILKKENDIYERMIRFVEVNRDNSSFIQVVSLELCSKEDESTQTVKFIVFEMLSFVAWERR